MFINSGSSTPTFVFPGDAVSRLLPGQGDFTCCTLGHCVNGREIACDKPKIHSVLSALIDSKLERLLATGKLLEYRYLTATRAHFLQGLSDAPAEADTRSTDDMTVEKLKKRLKWTDGDAKVGASSGWNLLKYAAIAGEVGAVRALLRGVASMSSLQKRQYIDAPLSQEGAKPLLHLHVPVRCTTLILTACFGKLHHLEEVLSLLLDAGADPHAAEGAYGMSAFISAAAFGRLESVKFFFERYPSAVRLEQPARGVGLTPLLYAAFFAPSPSQGPVVRLLLEHGADATYIASTGRTALLCSALNDQCDHTVLKELIERTKAAGMSIDLPCVPRTLKWKLIFFVMTRK
jgi:hypothetical protein